MAQVKIYKIDSSGQLLSKTVASQDYISSYKNDGWFQSESAAYQAAGILPQTSTQVTGWIDPATGKSTPVGVGIPVSTSTRTPTPTQQVAGTSGNFVEGKAYKNPNNPEIFLYKDGKMHWIQDEATYRKLFPNDPNIQNFEILPSTRGLSFGETIKSQQTITPSVIPQKEVSQEEKNLIKDIQNDPYYDATIEEELKKYFPEKEYGPFKGFFYTTEDEQTGKIPGGKKVGDYTAEGEFAYKAAKAQWEPYYKSEYEERMITPTVTKQRTAEDIETAKRTLEEERGPYLQKEERDYLETLNQYKKSFGQRGLTFSGEAQRTLGTQAAPVTTFPGTVELDRAYNLGKYEREFGRQQKALTTDLQRSIENYEKAKQEAELSRERGLTSSVATGVAQRESEALTRYSGQLGLHERTAPASTGYYL